MRDFNSAPDGARQFDRLLSQYRRGLVPPYRPRVDTFAPCNRHVSGWGEHMLDELLEPRCFGADDRLTCPNCRSTLRLKNRMPDASYGHRCEQQTFRCAACDFHIERSVDRDGKPPELVRY